MVARNKAAPPDDWGKPGGALLLNVYGNEQALILAAQTYVCDRLVTA
jgi:hypothetical protein